MTKWMLPILLIFFLIGGSGCGSQYGKLSTTQQNPQIQSLTPTQRTEILTTKKLRDLPPLNETDVVTPNNQLREFKLEAKKSQWELLSGVEAEAYIFNGKVPGLLIRAKEGETIRIILKNSLPNETSIHWHGLHVPNEMDGVPSYTQNSIKPGEIFTYEFTANHAGTYMYHSHFNSIDQIDKGLYGMLIIDPQEKEKITYDREYTMMFGGWNISNQPDDSGKKAEDDSMEGMPGMSKGTVAPLKQKGNIRSMIQQGMKHKIMPSETDTSVPGNNAGSSVMGMDYNYWTINGKSFPDTSPLDVKYGETVRIRLANISNGIHPMHLHGHDFRIIAKDSHPLSTPQIVNTVTVNPGETYDIDFIADNPGEWMFHCHELHHTTNADVEPGGLMAIVNYVK